MEPIMHFDSATRCESTFVVNGSLVRCGLRSSHDGVHMFPKAWWQWDDASAAHWSEERSLIDKMQSAWDAHPKHEPLPIADNRDILDAQIEAALDPTLQAMLYMGWRGTRADVMEIVRTVLNCCYPQRERRDGS